MKKSSIPQPASLKEELSVPEKMEQFYKKSKQEEEFSRIQKANKGASPETIEYWNNKRQGQKTIPEQSFEIKKNKSSPNFNKKYFAGGAGALLVAGAVLWGSIAASTSQNLTETNTCSAKVKSRYKGILFEINKKNKALYDIRENKLFDLLVLNYFTPES